MKFKQLVILGSGSTVATIPNGDKNGMKAYTLNKFLSDPYYSTFIGSLDPKYKNIEVEKLCAKLYSEDAILYKKFENLIREKYSRLELPNEFTILERLIMSLTADDAIVSFNWDDLIVQAYNRVLGYIPEALLPKLCFPHGNAQACYNKERYGSKRNPNNLNFWDSPLIIPANRFGYKENLFIKSQWHIFDFFVRRAQMITFFGYSGPRSDSQDMEHIKSLLKRNKICEKIEIIDQSKESAQKIATKWNDLIRLTESKADCCGSFYESRIAQFPRRALKSLCSWKYKPKMVDKIDRDSFMRFIKTEIEEEQQIHLKVD
ncbi:MAG: hypothetical protein LKE54_12055 [Prevotella sp.]|jgi:hypothetical protein|nr:hypothetical protein [Prevotella sp.]MCH3995746.1 hypothetical protein [Prevotella sp.]